MSDPINPHGPHPGGTARLAAHQAVWRNGAVIYPVRVGWQSPIHGGD